jgi:hypothetical protein
MDLSDVAEEKVVEGSNISIGTCSDNAGHCVVMEEVFQ